MLTTDKAPVTVSPRVVRMNPRQKWWWTTDPFWRYGPNTEDGFWFVHQVLLEATAVRVVRDEDHSELEASEFTKVLNEALHAERNDGQDAYLRTVTIAASLPMDELERIRESVEAGRTGGSQDGAA